MTPRAPTTTADLCCGIPYSRLRRSSPAGRETLPWRSMQVKCTTRGRPWATPRTNGRTPRRTCRSMRCGEAGRHSVGPQLGGHAAFDTHPPAYLNHLLGPQLGEAEAPQRLHVHEDVGRSVPARQEAEAAHAVEPFHHGPLPV